MSRPDLDDLRRDPTITPEMIDFVLACEQAEIELRNGTFTPVPPVCTGEADQPEWDKLSQEASASV